MKKILFTWLDNINPQSANKDGLEAIDPIFQVLSKRNFDQAIILSNYPTSKTKSYVDWLKTQKVQSNLSFTIIDLNGDPTDYRAIYENAKQQVQRCLDSSPTKVQFTFHLSAGTSQMATIWVILANSKFNAKLIQFSDKHKVQDVEFPFEISADYLPDLLKKSVRKISGLYADDAVEARFREIIHQSRIMKNLVRRAKSIAPYPVPVLIQGKSGTGKELLAKAIHASSFRNGKFVAINCGAIPEELFESELFGHKKGAFSGATSNKIGYIEEAEGGTLFLDEVGEMPNKIQVKLLRLLQEESFYRVGDSVEHQADVRIISATNRNLLEDKDIGIFREDLFHRLAVAILQVPALCDREDDVELLIDRLLNIANKKLGENKDFKSKKLSREAKLLLISHSWPGNVRELQNTLMRSAIWSQNEIITASDIKETMLPIASKNTKSDNILGKSLEADFDLDLVIGEVARHYLERAIKEAGGNKTKAAKLLNFSSYQRLDVWLKKYRIL